MRFALRTNKGSEYSCRSRERALLTAGWVTCNMAPARVRLPSL
jgi:hypothetical protein